MRIETNNLIIRELEASDEKYFVKMALDGSLEKDIGFDANCSKWISESKELTDKDDPTIEYLAYTVQLKDLETVISLFYKNFCKKRVGYVFHILYSFKDYLILMTLGEMIAPLIFYL